MQKLKQHKVFTCSTDNVHAGTNSTVSREITVERDTHSSKLKNFAVCRQLISNKSTGAHITIKQHTEIENSTVR